MLIGTDQSGKVLLVGDALPDAWNGVSLTVRQLSEEQRAAYAALPGDRSGVIFDGQAFKVLPPVLPSRRQVLLAELAAIDSALNAQRWNREGVLGLGDLIDLLRSAPEVLSLSPDATLAEVIAKVNECASLSAYLRAIPAPGSGMAKLAQVERVTAQGIRDELGAL